MERKIVKRIAGRPYQRARNSSLQYALEELKFIKSPQDLKVLFDNATYLLPRTVGSLGRSAKVPPSLQVEPTNCCNVDCLCCPAARSSRPRGFMDLGLFRRIVNDASRMGVKRMRLFLHGEPMLHPQIVDMIGLAKSNGLSVHLTTNGMLLDRLRCEAILRSGVNWADHVTVSILGYSPEVHERIMRRAHHERVLQNVLGFLELRRELGVNGPVVETVFYAMPENEHEEERFAEYWGGKVDHVRLGGRVSQSFSAYGQGGGTVTPRRRTCSNLWERMTIFWNGDVTLCCEDVGGEWVLGNLNEHGVKEIWNGEQLSHIRQIHREKRFREFPFCFKCDI